MLGDAEKSENLTVSPVSKDYGHFSSHQSFKANGIVTVLDKGKDSVGSR